MTIFAIIPVKKLDNAKSRLSSLLTNSERKQFCLKMLEDILRTVKFTKGIKQTVVVSNDPEVFQLTKNLEATYLEYKKAGLNEAVSEAINWCINRGATSVLILPADIPLVTPKDLNRILTLGEKTSIVISPSKGEKGTNALLLTPPNVCPTFYGPRSFQRHLEEATKRGIRFRSFGSPRIALDIDTVKDLKDFISANAKETSACKFLYKIGIHNRLAHGR
ncbi:2-phospho-L-lactate guanylyltransferase [Candidatus Bathyarchaeota archaeon]|nr:2-phospho-L-lactate guanylyltransferase [Candidatus Bathyarchaeota archaeon]MBS7628771.1 2-phospho-L-lactate guanylyltransferase [Candidatus Bathyarchaeota archaeon]